MKNIFVNATSCTVGGSKSILDQLLKEINNSFYNDKKITYYIFVSSEDFNIFAKENIKIIDVKSKKWSKRLLWDYHGLKKWSAKTGINADLILSMQNTGVKYLKNVPQIVYLHTPIPFVNYKWNFFKKNERILWFYKNIYPVLIKVFLNRNSILIVQSNWLKKIVSKKLMIPLKNIKIFIPNITLNSVDQLSIEKDNTENRESLLFFYPAFEYKYKNHEIIIKALDVIKNKKPEAYKKIKIIFTINSKSEVKKIAKIFNVHENIEFVGNLSKRKVEEYYIKSSAILFPSYIETFGLPLLEAKHYKKKVITTNEEFSYEILGDYKNVDFVDKFSAKDWADKIINVTENGQLIEKTEESKSKNSNSRHEQGWKEFVFYIENF